MKRILITIISLFYVLLLISCNYKKNALFLKNNERYNYVELDKTLTEECNNLSIEGIMIKYYEGRGIKAIDPKLATMLLSAKDYDEYKDDAGLYKTDKEWDYLCNNKNPYIYMLIIDTKYKTLNLEKVKRINNFKEKK